MDDLKLVRELGDETPLPDAAALAPARERLLAGMAGSAPVRLRQRRSRFAVVGGSTVGLAAAIAAVITLAPIGGPPPSANAAAVQLLHNAAAKARSLPDLDARAEQFVYVRSESGGSTREIWLSADGTRDGVLADGNGNQLLMPGCRDGRAVVVKGDRPLPGVTEPCEPRPAYRSDLPTDVDAMLAYLDRNASGEPGSVNARGKDVMGLISESYLPPRARAALWEAAARVPGLKVVEHTEDAAGRAGVGITWPVPEGSLSGAKPVVLVFDANTYEFLGTQSTAVVNLSIVDQAGQRP